MNRNVYNNIKAPECKTYASFILNLTANEQATLAYFIGIIMSQDLTPMEQQALGNFLMLVSQVMITISAQNFLVQQRIHQKNNNKL